MNTLYITRMAFCGLLLASAGSGAAQQIPKTWDDAAVGALELPLADRAYSPVHVTSADYYRLPIRPIYKSYPIYAPGKEPTGYIEWLKQREPVIVFDPAELRTETDWIRAGELVFDAPIRYRALSNSSLDNPELWKNGLAAPDGTTPFYCYVIRKKGTVEIGDASCAQCHTRIMLDGTVLKGAQSSFPGPHITAAGIRRRAETDNDGGFAQLALNRNAQRVNYGAPWIHPDPAEEYVNSFEDLVASWQAIPAGVLPREGASRRYAPQVPDLIGVKGRRYLDHTGLVRHRSIGDLMRYAALNQDAQFLARYGDFRPADFIQPGAQVAHARYSDEQLYALALYIYSLEPPQNPNKFDAVAARGQKLFEREGCARCHTPPLYTNNRLTLAGGFKATGEDRTKYDILPISVGTDPNLALRTRRGTGYYKVPSLKGVWYRGPFEHNGSVATLEDWFDPRRLRDDYVPTGYKPHGVKTRPVKGHEFGLYLSPEDKRALISFLKTL